MRGRVQGGWIIMGLAVLGATFAGGREARAALTGITITGGIKPVNPDPINDFIFEVFINPNTVMGPGDKFSIVGLPGKLKDGPDWDFGPDFKHEGHSFDLEWTAGTRDKTTHEFTNGIITWTDTDPVAKKPKNQKLIVNPSTSLVELGTIKIRLKTKDDQDIFAPLSYSYSVHDTSGNLVTATNQPLLLLSIPEPSSSTIVLLALGTAGLLGGASRLRRRLARAA